MVNAPKEINGSKSIAYDKKFSLMLGLMIAYNSYCINYYTLKPELFYTSDIKDGNLDKTVPTMMELEISRRFPFHTKTANFLNSAFIIIESTRTILREMNCDAITKVKDYKIKNMDISLSLVKELRNAYVHGKLLPLHVNYTTTYGKYSIDTVFNVVINKEHLLSLQNIKGALKQYLTESREHNIKLHDLFKRHFEFTVDLYSSIRDEFLKNYVICETTRFSHQQRCLYNGIGQKFDLIAKVDYS